MRRSRFVPLLTARRFAPLFLTQFLGAFNDNLLKASLGILVTYRLAEQAGIDAASLVMLAGGLFMAPFFLFSGASGTLADRVDKAVIARWVKIAEMAIMAVGACGLWWQSLPLLFVALFGLGTHSTVFGPIKYALLPQHLDTDELVAGNALIEAGTFLAILFGTIMGGSIVLVPHGPLVVGIAGVACACAGWLAAHFIPPAPASLGADASHPRLVHDSVDILRHVIGQPQLLWPVLAVSWFWLFGATVVSGLPVFAKDVLGADERVVTLMLALFAIGVGVGSLLAERLLHGEISARYVPLGGCVMAACALDTYLGARGYGRTAELAGLAIFLRQPGSWRILGDLVGLAIGGGLFTVPLYAILQHESEASHRARVIAANNIINALAMTVAALVAAALLSHGFTMAELFGWCGAATIPVVVMATWMVRRDLMKSLVRVVGRTLRRIQDEGLEDRVAN